MPDGTDVEIFNTTAARGDWEVSCDMPVKIGLTPTFLSAMRSLPSEYIGEFMISSNTVMMFPNDEPHLLRLYLFWASAWNSAFSPGASASSFDKQFLPAYTPEDLGALTNVLQPGVVEHLASDGADGNESAKREWRNARQRIRGWLNELELMALVSVEDRKDGKIRCLPPKHWEDARKRHNKHGSRPF
jgi:hypothetical protein